jgi:hypothetical protein
MGSSPNEVDFFNLPNPFNHTMTLESTQRVRLTNLPPSVSQQSIENVGASRSHNPMGLHGLLQG